jgi:hypothetical protein
MNVVAFLHRCETIPPVYACGLFLSIFDSNSKLSTIGISERACDLLDLRAPSPSMLVVPEVPLLAIQDFQRL